MIKCSIMNGLAYAPIYISGTKRVVCVPNMEEIRLATTVDKQSVMEVLVDDQVVETRELETGRKHFLNLAVFLDRGAGEATSGWGKSQPTKKEPAREFTIRYKNADAGSEVVATFDFKVADSTAFKLGKLKHSVLHDQTAHESDANPNKPTWPCWNCDSVGRNRRSTCDNCGAPKNHPSSLKLHD